MKTDKKYFAPYCVLCAIDTVDVITVSDPHISLEDIDDIVKDDFALIGD